MLHDRLRATSAPGWPFRGAMTGLGKSRVTELARLVRTPTTPLMKFVAGAARFPGVLLSRGPLRACCYRSGSAAAARAGLPIRLRHSPRRSSACAAARPGPPGDLDHGVRGFNGDREHRQPPRPAQAPPHAMTIPTTVEASLYRGVSVALKKGADRARWRSRRRAAGVGVPAAAGALVPGSRNTPSLCSRWMFCCMFCCCFVAPRPGSALPCPGPTPPARSQQRSSTRPGPADGARRPSARPRQRPG